MREAWDTFIRHQTEYPMSRILGAFYHDDPNELDVLENKYHGDLITMRKHQTRRSVSWLRGHGTCGDLLYMKHQSTLPQAGRGAFAKHDLPAGAVVAAVPLIHVANRNILDTYPIEFMPAHGPYHPNNREHDEEDHDDGFYWANRTRGKLPPQLFLNYCFGHAEGTLLLKSYGT